MTVRDVVFLTDAQIVHKRSEIFKRISAKKLKLLLESAPLSESIVSQNNENIEKNSLPISDGLIRRKKEFQSEMRRNFLIVDLRESQNFEDYHIKEAISIPSICFN